VLVIKVGQLTNAAIAAHIRKKRYHVTDSLMKMLIGSHSDAIGKKVKMGSLSGIQRRSLDIAHT
jgi:hypothetical protein